MAIAAEPITRQDAAKPVKTTFDDGDSRLQLKNKCLMETFKLESKICILNLTIMNCQPIEVP